MIEYITYKGKRYPLRVSYFALKSLKAETGKDLEALDDLAILEPLLWFALIAGHKHMSLELKIERNDLEFVLDECMFEFMELIPKFMGANKKKQTPKTAKK